VNPDDIETSYSLAGDPRKRIKFQADVQDYIDMGISSTINLPTWGTSENNDSGVEGFAEVLSEYAPRLRGFTCYPNGARGGQPLTEIPYSEAIQHKGVVYEEQDVCDITGKGGVCSV
jgi:ribonucleoside-diphosphate reductase alpha chain